MGHLNIRHQTTAGSSQSLLSASLCSVSTPSGSVSSQRVRQTHDKNTRKNHENMMIWSDESDDMVLRQHRTIPDSHRFIGSFAQHNMIQKLSDPTSEDSIAMTSHLKELHRRVKRFRIREILRRIFHTMIDIYMILEEQEESEQEEEEQGSNEKKSGKQGDTKKQKNVNSHGMVTIAMDWVKSLLSLASFFSSQRSEGEDDTKARGNNETEEEDLYSGTFKAVDRSQLIASRMRSLPIVPFYMTLVLNSVEISLKVFTALSLAALVASARLHKAFQHQVKPFVLYYSLLLDIFLKQRLSQLSAISDIRERTLLYILGLITHLRKRNPDMYYRLITLYLRTISFANIPKEIINNLMYLTTAIYFHGLLLSIYVLKQLSPRLQILLEKSWHELYELVEQLLSYVRQSEIYQELN